MDALSALIVLVGIGGALWLWRRHRGGTRTTEEQLRRICLGDGAQAERLIEGEMSRAPGVSRAEAVRRAVERYQRDNR